MANMSVQDWDEAYAHGNTPWHGQWTDFGVWLQNTGVSSGVALDLGCGSGEYTRQLLARGFNVEGIDFSPEAIKAARMNAPGADLVIWDLEKLADYPFEHTHYDLILDIKVLAFIRDKERYLDIIRDKLSRTFLLQVWHRHTDSTDIVVSHEEFDQLILPRFRIQAVQRWGRDGKESAAYMLAPLS